MISRLLTVTGRVGLRMLRGDDHRQTGATTARAGPRTRPRHPIPPPIAISRADLPF